MTAIGGFGTINVREFFFGNETNVIPVENAVSTFHEGIICVRSDIVLKPTVSEVTYGLIGGLVGVAFLFTTSIIYIIIITRRLNRLENGSNPEKKKKKSAWRVFGTKAPEGQIPSVQVEGGVVCQMPKKVNSVCDGQNPFDEFRLEGDVTNGSLALASAPYRSSGYPYRQPPHLEYVTPFVRGPSARLYPRLEPYRDLSGPKNYSTDSPFCVSENQILGKGCKVALGSIDNLNSFLCTKHDPEHGCSGTFPEECDE